eukprot:13637732-Alexandrium_andersonii.AAC.1
MATAGLSMRPAAEDEASGVVLIDSQPPDGLQQSGAGASKRRMETDAGDGDPSKKLKRRGASVARE